MNCLRISASVPNRRRPTSSSKNHSSTFHQRSAYSTCSTVLCAPRDCERENVFSSALSGGQARPETSAHLGRSAPFKTQCTECCQSDRTCFENPAEGVCSRSTRAPCICVRLWIGGICAIQ
uniref:(northern house mosquito) hypothetical protein n=1 Tax=Culex pipiens TaxID=7175 RepID=A0A8D8KCK8_CULPI